jgi:hypothetical protein
MHGVVGTTQEGSHIIKGKKIPPLIIKAYLDKTYDKASGIYLRLFIIHIGMRIQLLNWIMGCLLLIFLYEIICYIDVLLQ